MLKSLIGMLHPLFSPSNRSEGRIFVQLARSRRAFIDAAMTFKN